MHVHMLHNSRDSTKCVLINTLVDIHQANFGQYGNVHCSNNVWLLHVFQRIGAESQKLRNMVYYLMIIIIGLEL